MTEEGTNYFESLNKAGKKDFYEKLKQELANAIPVSPERITTNERFAIETSISQKKQIVLSINIKKDEIGQERPANLAAKDLNTLIKNKIITTLAAGETSKYLDQNYGYQTPGKN